MSKQSELDDIHSLIHQPSFAVVYPETEIELDYPVARRILDWHNKQVLEIIGDDQSQKRPEGGKNTAEWTNGRNNLRQQQRNKLKEIEQ